MSPRISDGPWAPSQAEDLRSELLHVVAALVGVESTDIALTPSASYGIALARTLVRLRPGDQVLMLQTDHPASVLPWYAECRMAGASVQLVDDTTEDLTEATLSRMSHAVRVVNVPQVHWIDGRRLDLTRIARRAREVGALLVVDATQSVGGRPFKIAEIEPDVVTFSGYKWLLGPIGVAYFYLAPALRNLVPFEHSWISYAGKHTEMFDVQGGIRYPTHPLHGIRRFDASGLHNPLMLRMALAGAKLIREVGPERVLAHNARLLSRIRGEFPNYVPDMTEPCHYVGMRIQEARRIAQLLAARSIYASARGRFLRISPNVWNDDYDIDTLISGLRSFAVGEG
ncbi:MAG: aminotransferase class V-fold PLP-dependent enzyme [Steroidobacteraceae bacterium]